MRSIPVPAVVLLAFTAFGFNGSVESIGEIEIVNLWGTWEEMGYAHGRLLGPDLMTLYQGYFLELAGGTANVEMLRGLYGDYFTVPQEFRDYAAGIILGAADTISLWSPVYGRDLDTLDIYITSSVPDLSAMADMPFLMCSSASAFGEATIDDPVLQGNPAVSRNLDYFVDQNGDILSMSRLFVHDPQQGQDWVSVSFPGFMGSLSGMNQSGVNASLNMGNYPGTSQTSPRFVPICMALTLGLTRNDFDQSGSHDIQDLKEALTFWNRSNTYVIHVTSPLDLAGGSDPSVVVEVNNHQGYRFRYPEDEPSIAPGRMLLTNHHRVLYSPVACWRYSRMLDSLAADPAVTLDRLWNFMGAVGFPPVPGTGGTLQTMIFQPEEKRIGLAFASSGVSAPEKEPRWIEWNDVYPNHGAQGVETAEHPCCCSVLQNPVMNMVQVQCSNTVTLALFSLNGRRMDIDFTRLGGVSCGDVSSLPPGVYLLNAETGAASAEWFTLCKL